MGIPDRAPQPRSASSPAAELGSGHLDKAECFISVSTCGQACDVPTDMSCSIDAVQNALQDELKMGGETFYLFNCDGEPLSADVKLRESPLCTTLTDASATLVKNPHEELTQIECKFVRDQMPDADSKITLLIRPDPDKRERDSLNDKVHNAVQEMLENEREFWKTELGQLSGRVNAVAQFVNSERNKRELSLLTMGNQVQGMRDMLDAERTACRQELSTYVTFIQDCKNSLEDSKRSQGVLEAKHATDFHSLNERVDMLSGHYAGMLEDQLRTFRDYVKEICTSFQWQNHQIQHMRETEEAHTAEALQRFRELEKYCSNMESRLVDAEFGQKFQFNKEERDWIWSTPDKTKHFEHTIGEVVDVSCEHVMKEYAIHDNQFDRQQEVTINEQDGQIIGSKVLEHEVSQIDEEVAKPVVVDQDASAQSMVKSHPAVAFHGAGTCTSLQRSNLCSSPQAAMDSPKCMSANMTFRSAARVRPGASSLAKNESLTLRRPIFITKNTQTEAGSSLKATHPCSGKKL